MFISDYILYFWAKKYLSSNLIIILKNFQIKNLLMFLAASYFYILNCLVVHLYEAVSK